MNWKLKLIGKPREDFFFSQNAGVVVADGVTRDPEGMPWLPSHNNPIGMFRFGWKYPKPSAAKETADYVADCLGSKIIHCFSPGDMRNAFDSANKDVQRIAEEYLRIHRIAEFDYLEHDIPSCVAAAAFTRGRKLTWGFITDCGIAAFDEAGKRQFQTPDESPESRGNIVEDIRAKYPDIDPNRLGFRNPDVRRIIRRDYRNNLGFNRAYGVLSGEEEAMHYVRTGEWDFGNGWTAIAYTDGLKQAVEDEDFGKAVRERNFRRLEELCRRAVKTEGALAYILRC